MGGPRFPWKNRGFNHGNMIVGLEHEFYFSIYWEESFQLTSIFFRGDETTNQL
jgi:hypothetical protein